MNIITLSAYGNKIGFGQALNISLTGMLVVFIVLIILAVLVSLMSKLILKLTPTKKKIEIEKTSYDKSNNQKNSAPQVELINVDEKTAAVIMAIVSNESEIPLDHLKFNYIKLIEEEKK